MKTSHLFQSLCDYSSAPNSHTFAWLSTPDFSFRPRPLGGAQECIDYARYRQCAFLKPATSSENDFMQQRLKDISECSAGRRFRTAVCTSVRGGVERRRRRVCTTPSTGDAALCTRFCTLTTCTETCANTPFRISCPLANIC